MDFRSFWSSLSAPQKDAFALAIKHSRNYLDQIACGARKPGHRLARTLHDASKGIVSLHALRPDIWVAAA